MGKSPGGHKEEKDFYKQLEAKRKEQKHWKKLGSISKLTPMTHLGNSMFGKYIGWRIIEM
jgi:hypothetical protein